MNQEDYNMLGRYVCEYYDHCPDCPFYDLEDCDNGYTALELLQVAKNIADNDEDYRRYMGDVIDRYFGGKITIL